jgi:hypothetical protein
MLRVTRVVFELVILRHCHDPPDNSVRGNLSRIVEVSLFKREHPQTQPRRDRQLRRPHSKSLLFGFCCGAWIAFWSRGPDWAGWPRGTGWSGNSGRTRRSSGTLGTRVAFRAGWTGWPFKAASERQAGYERNCCRDTHASPPPVILCVTSSQFGGRVNIENRPVQFSSH